MTDRAHDAARASLPLALIWEDDTSATPAWWLSRANFGGFQFFVARDPTTGDLLGIVKSEAMPYRVIAVASAASDPANLKSRLVDAVVRSDMSAGPDVRRWKYKRAFRLMIGFIPLALLSLAAGGAIGAAVALFAISTGLIGWPMAAVGVAFGAGAGPVLKAIAERKHGPDAGAWPKFLAATVFAALGAALAAGGLLILFQV